MNKQELIKHIENLPYNEGLIVDTIKISRKGLLKLIEQLDEPEAGHADEAPRYVKNILARLRELPLHDREVWLKAIMGEFEQDFSLAKWREGYEQGKLEGSWVGNQLKNADKVRQELNKPVVPQVVIDYYEFYKEKLVSFEEWFAKFEVESDEDFQRMDEVGKWLYDVGDFKTQTQRELALAMLIVNGLDAVEIEKDKRYLVKMKGLNEDNSYLNYDSIDAEWYFTDAENGPVVGTHHTRKELEQAGFGWVFDCPGIEVREVE